VVGKVWENLAEKIGGKAHWAKLIRRSAGIPRFANEAHFEKFFFFGDQWEAGEEVLYHVHFHQIWWHFLVALYIYN
jgi:hypothetical protein